MGSHSRATMPHGISEGPSSSLIDVVHRKCLFQLSEQHLWRWPASAQSWRTIGHKGFIRMDMRLHKTREYKFTSDIKPFVGCGMECRGNGANTPMLNSDVLLLPSDKTALHNQIVHASSWHSLSRRERAGVIVLAYSALRVLTTQAMRAIPMWVGQQEYLRVEGAYYRGIK